MCCIAGVEATHQGSMMSTEDLIVIVIGTPARCRRHMSDASVTGATKGGGRTRGGHGIGYSGCCSRRGLVVEAVAPAVSGRAFPHLQLRHPHSAVGQEGRPSGRKKRPGGLTHGRKPETDTVDAK